MRMDLIFLVEDEEFCCEVCVFIEWEYDDDLCC